MTPDPGPFSSTDLCRLSGASFRRIDYWARTGALVPRIAAANGSGSQRRYSIAEARAAVALAMLTEVGLARVAMRKVGRWLCTREDWTGHVAFDATGRVHEPSVAAAGWLLDLEAVAERLNEALSVAA